MSFAELLRCYREAAGYTQMELSVRSGLTQGAVAHYERGAREPTWVAVQKLADALEIAVEAFRTDTSLPDPSEIKKKYPMSVNYDMVGPDIEEVDGPASGSLSHPQKPAKKGKGGAGAKKGKK